VKRHPALEGLGGLDRPHIAEVDIAPRARAVALAEQAQEKLARLLLSWSAGIQQSKEGTRIKMPLTHEEIAEFIGTSRETVTRTLSDFKERHLVTIQGSTMMIPNRAALESFVNG